ncbi:MAG: 16S rRNA (cytosine(1402)-N(4))-methyltransferase RsmH [Microgenomates group bacterium]
MHTPVLLQPVIESLNIKKDGLYIDATFGEGGYTKEILKRGGKVLALDWDKSQIDNFNFSYLSDLEKKRLILVNANFADLEKIAKDNNFFPVDGVVFDLGLSMRQISESKRGFSYQKIDEFLDMRLNSSLKTTAAQLIKKLTEEELYQLLAKYSEEIRSKEIAHEIKETKKINTVADLIGAIDRAIGFSNKKVYARVFQALRIAVNKEFENLEKGLQAALKILKKTGRIVVVDFHSLEDRVVKNFARKNQLKFLKIKKIKNYCFFERSAKLRVITL